MTRVKRLSHINISFIMHVNTTTPAKLNYEFRAFAILIPHLPHPSTLTTTFLYSQIMCLKVAFMCFYDQPLHVLFVQYITILKTRLTYDVTEELQRRATQFPRLLYLERNNKGQFNIINRVMKLQIILIRILALVNFIGQPIEFSMQCTCRIRVYVVCQNKGNILENYLANYLVLQYMNKTGVLVQLRRTYQI